MHFRSKICIPPPIERAVQEHVLTVFLTNVYTVSSYNVNAHCLFSFSHNVSAHCPQLNGAQPNICTPSHTNYIPLTPNTFLPHQIHSSHTIYIPLTLITFLSHQIHSSHIIYIPLTPITFLSHHLHSSHTIDTPITFLTPITRPLTPIPQQ